MDGDPKPQSLGGRARAERLSPERRSEIARDAARTRWGAGAGGDDAAPAIPAPAIVPAAYGDVAIGRNVRIMRNLRGMDAAELATLCGVGYQKALRLENGGIPFDIALLCKIAGILDTTPGRLLDGPLTHRMIDLTGIPDEQAAALEIMADAVRQGPDRKA